MKKVKVFNRSRNPLPEYKTIFSSGMDLMADLPEGEIRILHPNQRLLIPTGLFMEIPQGYEAQVRPRSGLSLKVGLIAILGTIDADYRGEVGIIATNISNSFIKIENGDRIAQLVFQKIEQMEWEVISSPDEFSETERGSNGFGHTGV